MPKDAVGNEIRVGDLVQYDGDFKKIARVEEIHEGGVNLRNTGVTPQTIKLTFTVTVVAQPKEFFNRIAVLKDPASPETKIATA